MFPYVVAFFGVLLLFYDPLTRYLTADLEPRRLPRTPRPPINESLVATDDADGLLNCAPDAYSIHIVSKAPLVVYIENFLSLEEREHLLEIR
jgi:prolyl 4-hydroxylase